MEIVPADYSTPTSRKFGKRRHVWLSVAIALVVAFMFLVAGATIEKSGFIRNVAAPIVAANTKLPRRYLEAAQVAPPRFTLDIKFKHYKKLDDQRQDAIARGVLFTTADDMVPAELSFGDKKVKTKLRLKGDWVDHLMGSKWSFRVVADGDETIEGMSELSLQHPKTRNYAYEWLHHEMLKREDLIALRYQFVTLTLNGTDLGVYALEEHMGKRLIEFNKRREGPIVRFNEDLLWNELADVQLPNPGAERPGSGEYSASLIDGFGEKRLFSRASLKEQYLRAGKSLESFRRGELKASEVFDVKRFATFLALIDVLGGVHGAIWHNARFYFNPLTSRLEPVGFDFNSGEATKTLVGFGTATSDPGRLVTQYEQYWQRIFEDQVFLEEYLAQLERVSAPEYLDQVFTDLEEPLKHEMAVLYREFPDFEIDRDRLENNQKYIRAILHPQSAAHAWTSSVTLNRLALDVANVHRFPVEVVAVEVGGVVYSPKEPIRLPAKQPEQPLAPKRIEFLAQGSTKFPDLKAAALVHRVAGTTGTLRTALVSRAFSPDLPPDFLRTAPNVGSFAFLSVDEANKTIRVRPGTQVIDRDLVIPAGYSVQAGPGTTLDLTKSAVILSFSPLQLTGTRDEPIRIITSDGTGQGLAVIQSKKPSALHYVYFEKLRNPQRGNFAPTGAVSFYESDVSFSFVRSIDNQSEDALNIIRSKFDFEDVSFLGTLRDGFDSDFSQGRMKRVQYARCGNDCFDASGSTIQLEDVTVEGAGDKAISVGEASSVAISKLKVKNANCGLVSKDTSRLTAKEVELTGVTYDLASYRKKPEFGPGWMQIEQLLISDEAKYAIEVGSNVSIDEKQLPATLKHLRGLFYPNLYPNEWEGGAVGTL